MEEEISHCPTCNKEIEKDSSIILCTECEKEELLWLDNLNALIEDWGKEWK